MATDKKHKIKKKPCTEMCKCFLTKDELLAYGQKMADAQEERTSLEDQLASVKKEYQAKIDAAVATADRIGGSIRAGYKHRQTDCEIVHDWTDKTVKIYRLDTLECIRSRPMTEDEKQLPLDAVEVDAGDIPSKQQ